MPIDASDFASGRLVSELTTATTSGVQVQMDRINGAYRTMPTGSFYIYLRRKSETDTYTEKVLVASGTTNNSTTGIATLGTLTRNISLTSGTDTTGTSATYTWPSGTLVYQGIGAEVVERVALLNEANSFSQELDVTGNNNYVGLPSMTTANAPAYAAGRMYFDTTDNLPKIGVGGSFTNMTSGSVADASTTVAGKVEEATLAEISAGTAAGGTGARLFVNPTHVKKNSTGAAEGNVVALNSSVAVDATIGGTGQTTSTKGDILVSPGSNTWNKLAVGTNNHVLTADSSQATGVKWALPTSTNYEKLVVLTGASSTSITHSGSNQFYDTVTYTIPANDLISGVAYEMETILDITSFTSGTPAWLCFLGSTNIASFSLGAGPSVGQGVVRLRVFGTASAGASVNVRGTIEISFRDSTNAQQAFGYGEVAVATNGTLAFRLGVVNGTMASILRGGSIRRISTTAF